MNNRVKTLCAERFCSIILQFSLLMACLFFAASPATANNITITNPRLTGQNIKNRTINIAFDLSWENSFRTSTGPSNWDAAWVFVKYKVAKASGGDGIWRHVQLQLLGNISPAGSTIKAVTEGAFIYRSADGNGTFTVNNVQLIWNYSLQLEKGNDDFIDDDDAIDIRVFGIEMVYVPEGKFNVGGGGGNNAFTSTDITTSNASVPGAGYPTGIANNNGLFPNGYNAFYCMKYEVSQQQYADYLNNLQGNYSGYIIDASLSYPKGTALMHFYMNARPRFTVSNRNGLQVKETSSSESPGIVGLNLDNDMSFDEPEDGQSLACNWISHYRLFPFLDWCGLRPMTELEYEKACRGFAQPVAKEYAWGTADINLSGDVLNTGTDREVAQNKLANISAGSAGVLNGPTRVGSFARETTNRVLAGSSFFGILDLSGNLREVTVLVTENPKFTGLHGDGETKTNVQFWPASETHPTSPNLYVILRGDFDMGVSTRNYPVTILDINPSERDGGRGVRTAP